MHIDSAGAPGQGLGLDLEPRRDLHEVAREFEAMLVAEVLKGLSDAMGGADSPESMTSTLDGIVWMELSRQLAQERSLGLAETVYRQLVPDAEPSAPATEPTSVPGSSRGEPVAGHEAPAAGPRATPAAGPRATTPGAGSRMTPVAGRLSSDFGLRRDPFSGAERLHRGIDVAAAEGTRVRAPEAGRVVFAGARRGYGRTVIVEHDSGVQTLYAHLSRVDVKEGERLGRGSVLGAVGETGRATGPHLHFEVRRDGEAIDPKNWINAGLRARGAHIT